MRPPGGVFHTIKIPHPALNSVVAETLSQIPEVRGGEADFRTRGSLVSVPRLASHREFESALPSNSFELTAGGILRWPGRDPTLELRPQRRLSKCSESRSMRLFPV